MENIIELITENKKADSNFVWNPYGDIAGQVKKIYKTIAGQTKPLGSAIHRSLSFRYGNKSQRRR